MTVEDEHVYHVGLLNLLAHNNGCLTFNGKDSWTSKAGLIYGPDTSKNNQFKNHVQHVFSHLEVNLDKVTHTVFSVNRKELLPLLDEAWNSSQKQQILNDPCAYVIDMGRVIGTAGETKIRLVFKSPNSLEVRTAYPVP
jgi:filamentous hemagglutinin